MRSNIIVREEMNEEENEDLLKNDMSYQVWDKIHSASIKCNLDLLTKLTNDDSVNSLIKVSKRTVKHCSWLETNLIKPSYSNNPLHVILKFGDQKNKNFLNCIRLLLDKGVDISHKDSRGNTPLNLIDSLNHDQKMAIKDMLTTYKTNNTKTKMEFPFTKSDEEICDIVIKNPEFSTLFDGDNLELSSITLLQWCCKRGYQRSIHLLLEQHASPNFIIEHNKKYSLLYLARYPLLFKKIIGRMVYKLPTDILVKWMNTSSILKNATNDSIDVLLQHISMKINKIEYLHCRDDNGRTALHYAALYGLENYFQKFLDLGASLTIKDKWGRTVINLVHDPDMLSNYFDSCIQANSTQLMNAGTKIQMNYFSLILDRRYDGVETNAVNLESEFLKSLIETRKLKHLVEHVLVQTFILLKWRKLQWAFWFFLSLNVLANCCIVMYSLFYDGYLGMLNLFLIIGFLFVLFEFLLELYIYRKKSIKRVSVWVTGFLILSSFLLCYRIIIGYNVMSNLSSMALCATFKIFLQLEIHPHFTLRVIVLRKIIVNFFTTISYYMLLVVSFAFSFYLLSNKEQNFISTFYNTTLAIGGLTDQDIISLPGLNSFYGHCLFILFVFLIGIIVPNLLIGLTISDINKIENDAEYTELKEIARYIIQFESLLYRKFKLQYYCLKLFTNPNLFNYTQETNNFLLIIYPNKTKNISTNDDTPRIRLSIEPAIKKLKAFILEKAKIITNEKINNSKLNVMSQKTSEIPYALNEKITQIFKKLNKMEELLNTIVRSTENKQ